MKAQEDLHFVKQKMMSRDFPGCPVVKNLPWNARDTSWISGATNPMCHNYWASSLESESHNYWAPMLQLLKSASLEPMHHKRSHCNEKLAQHNKEQPHSPQLEKAWMQQWRPTTAKYTNKSFLKKERNGIHISTEAKIRISWSQKQFDSVEGCWERAFGYGMLRLLPSC